MWDPFSDDNNATDPPEAEHETDDVKPLTTTWRSEENPRNESGPTTDALSSAANESSAPSAPASAQSFVTPPPPPIVQPKAAMPSPLVDIRTTGEASAPTPAPFGLTARPASTDASESSADAIPAGTNFGPAPTPSAPVPSPPTPTTPTPTTPAQIPTVGVPFTSSTREPDPTPTPQRAAAPPASGPAPSGAYAPAATESGRRVRMWPLVLLALLTVAASGLVSWFVASQIDETDTVQAPVVVNQPTDDQSVVQPDDNAVDRPVATSIVPSILFDEPFALAAEKIEASVVQLTLTGGLGSGVIVDTNGTILTAAHVVGTNDEVQVRLFDGSIVDGDVLGTHEPTDVAVVKIDPTGRDLVAAPIANVDDIQVGQLAVAVGSPFGFEQTVTAGIISGVDRVVNQVSMVQTDAPINPGNSGGPLINLDGEVVGINDLIFTQSGTSAGVGFAISIDLASLVADQIIAGEDVQLALLGVETAPDPDGRAGALVMNVVPDSAADDAGIETGDLLVGIDGRPTSGGAQLRAQVIGSAPGTTIILDVVRDGDQLQVEATLGSTG